MSGVNESTGDEALLESIGKLMAQADGDTVTMEQIAAECGVSRATLYRRFGSREALLRRAAEHCGLDADAVTVADARTRILQAARTVFSRHGFAAATIEQVAQEAGVGPATVYRHFGSKDGLIEAFVQSSAPRRLLRRMVENEFGHLEEDLVRFAAVGLEFLHENRDLIRLSMIEHQVDAGILGQLRGARERTVTNLARYFERQMEAETIRKGDPAALAFAFTGSLFSLAVIAPLMYDRPLDDIETTAQQLVAWFLDGIRAEQLATRKESDR